EEETIVASCTCPHYDDGHLCKHIWAAVLTAESKGQLNKIADMGQPYIETGIEHEESGEDDGDFREPDEFDEDGEDDDFEVRLPYRDEYQPGSRAAGPSKAASWKQHLTNLRAASPAEVFATTEGKRRIIYVADIVQSVSSGGLVVQAAACRLKKNGEWSKAAFQEHSIQDVSKLDAADQQILALLS